MSDQVERSRLRYVIEVFSHAPSIGLNWDQAAKIDKAALEVSQTSLWSYPEVISWIKEHSTQNSSYDLLGRLLEKIGQVEVSQMTNNPKLKAEIVEILTKLDKGEAVTETEAEYMRSVMQEMRHEFRELTEAREKLNKDAMRVLGESL